MEISMCRIIICMILLCDNVRRFHGGHLWHSLDPNWVGRVEQGAQATALHGTVMALPWRALEKVQTGLTSSCWCCSNCFQFTSRQRNSKETESTCINSVLLSTASLSKISCYVFSSV